MVPAGHSPPLSSCVDSVMITLLHTEHKVCAGLCSEHFTIVGQFVPDTTCP